MRRGIFRRSRPGWWIALGAAMVAAVCAPRVWRSRFVTQRRAARELGQARLSVASRDFDRARVRFRAALRLEPFHATARHELADMELGVRPVRDARPRQLGACVPRAGIADGGAPRRRPRLHPPRGADAQGRNARGAGSGAGPRGQSRAESRRRAVAPCGHPLPSRKIFGGPRRCAGRGGHRAQGFHLLAAAHPHHRPIPRNGRSHRSCPTGHGEHRKRCGVSAGGDRPRAGTRAAAAAPR